MGAECEVLMFGFLARLLPTYVLQREIEQRPGVRDYDVEPYEEYTVKVTCSCIVTINED